MKALKSSLLAFILIPAVSFAGNVDMSGSGEDCTSRVNQFAHLPTLQRGVCERAAKAGYNTDKLGCGAEQSMNAAHFMDRDNSTTDANDEPGKAMGIVRTLNGYTQSIQVCPGVYLATAHGALDSPELAKKENRNLRPPSENRFLISAYPLSKENVMRTKNDSNFISPRLRDSSNWNKAGTDYVFIKVDKPVRPNNYVEPVQAPASEIIQASNRGNIDIHLYRGKTRFNTDRNGTPDFDRDTWASDVGDIKELYSAPQRVTQRCEVQEGSEPGLIGHNCPTEASVSGSSQITEIEGKNYLVGLHAFGDATARDSSLDGLPNEFIQSQEFCADYQTACGRPCANLKDLQDNSFQSVSL